MSTSKSYDLRPDSVGVAEVARLTKQAEALFEYEMSPLREIFSSAAEIVDLGAGACDYLEQFRKFNVSAQLIGVEKNPFFSKDSKKKQLASVLEMDVFDYLKCDERIGMPQPTVYLARFFLQHVGDGDISKFFRLLANRRGEAVIVECDDTYFSCNTDDVEKLHAGLATRQERNGGNRYLGRNLAKFAAEAGIELISTRRVIYSLDSIGLENMASVFVKLLAANNRIELDRERQLAIAREIAFCSYVVHLKLRQ